MESTAELPTQQQMHLVVGFDLEASTPMQVTKQAVEAYRDLQAPWA